MRKRLKLHNIINIIKKEDIKEAKKIMVSITTGEIIIIKRIKILDITIITITTIIKTSLTENKILEIQIQLNLSSKKNTEDRLHNLLVIANKTM